ncbi:MAG: CHASE2 domain-containing protein [Cyanobacteria bacterium P01_D01_bin.156]
MQHWLRKSGWRLLPGILAVGLTLGLARAGIFQPFEHGVYRLLFRLRGEQPWDEQVAVIEIDEASLEKIGPFPWPRSYYTDLLQQLTPARPSVIAFDILFAGPSDDDTDLARAMANHGNVVLATAWDGLGAVIGPNADVMKGAIATGHIHHQADPDGITRFYQAKVNGTMALSIQAVEHHSQKFASNISVPISKQALWLNWRGKSHTATRYSFSDVLLGKIPAEKFTNKIIFIGFTGGSLDTMTTPYNLNIPTAGVYQHIVAANNLLSHNHLKRPRISLMSFFLLIASTIFGYSLFSNSFTRQTFSCLSVVVIWGVTVVIAFNNDYWLPIAAPLAATVLTANFVKLSEGSRPLKKVSLSSEMRAVGHTLPLAITPSLGNASSTSKRYQL